MRPTTTNSPAGGISATGKGGGMTNVPAGRAADGQAIGGSRQSASGPVGSFQGSGLAGSNSGGRLPPWASGGGAGNVGRNALAALFMGNPPASTGQLPGMPPAITQPRPPIVEMPPGRRPFTPTAPQPPAPLPRFGTLNELRGYMIQNPGKLTVEQISQLRRGLQPRGGSR